MLKIKDLLQKQYDLFKDEYQRICNRLPVAKIDLHNAEQKLKEEYGYDDIDIWHDRVPYYLIHEYNKLKDEIKDIPKQQSILLEKMNKINEILNNDEHIISLQRKQLDKFSRGKVILEIGTSAIGNSNANIKGKLNGRIDGNSFLGFGNINGSINGNLNGTSNSYYEEYILVKYRYNLDYEIEEFLFNIDDYLKIED